MSAILFGCILNIIIMISVVNDECYVLNSKFLFPVVLNILTSARMFASIDTPALTIVCSIF